MDAKRARQMKRKTLGRWFKAERDMAGMTQKEVADILGQTHMSVSSYERDGLSYRTLLQKCEQLGWEVPAEREILKTHGNTPTNTQPLFVPDLTGKDSAWPLSQEWLEENAPNVIAESLRYIKAPDNSMALTLMKGDRVLVDTSVNTFEGEGNTYVFEVNGETYIRRIARPQGEIHVIANGPSIPTWKLDPKQPVKIYGQAIGKLSGYIPL